jgi:hypothetical protein
MTDPTVIPSIRGGVVEKFLPGDRVTFTVANGQAATGGKLQKAATGSLVCQDATAGSLLVVGVAMHDAAAGASVTVATEGVWLLKASGQVNAGDRVKAASSGDVSSVAPDVTATPTESTIESALGAIQGVVGFALADITTGELGPVKLTL